MSLSDYFSKVVNRISALSDDLERMKYNIEEPTKKKDMKSLQQVTRLRSSKEEAINAAENPEITFINDQLNDLFKD